MMKKVDKNLKTVSERSGEDKLVDPIKCSLTKGAITLGRTTLGRTSLDRTTIE
jgi:hypothetical protein